MPPAPWLRVLLGTRPGLEHLAFALGPAIVAGAFAASSFGAAVGFAVGAITLALGVLAARALLR